jgi:hypothetical protein
MFCKNTPDACACEVAVEEDWDAAGGSPAQPTKTHVSAMLESDTRLFIGAILFMTGSGNERCRKGKKVEGEYRPRIDRHAIVDTSRTALYAIG